MSIDTVNDLPPRVQYVASAAQTIFPYPFPIFADADLTVYVDGAVKTLNTEYTVTGEGDDLGGDVTFAAPMTGGEIVTIYRDIAIERDTDISQNGPWSSTAYNDEQDKVFLLLQQLKAQLARSLRIPIIAEVDDGDIELTVANFANTYLSFDSDGKPTPAVLSAQTLTQTLLGQLFYPISGLESAALVTPVAFYHYYGDVRRYGGVGSGSVDDRNALAAALSTGHRVLGGGPEYVYRIDSTIAVTGNVDIDLQGATLAFSSTGQGIVRNSVGATASTTVSSGATMGSRSVVVASATGLAAGQWFLISADDFATHDALSYPVCWGKIDNVAGTTITLDRTLPVTYSGTISFAAYNTNLILGKCHVRNGVLDGSASTYDGGTGQAFRIGTYESVKFENIHVKNFDNNGTNTCAIQVYVCVDASIENSRATGTVSAFAPWDVQMCRVGKLVNNVVDGSSFGGNVTRCEFALVANSEYMGYRKKEFDNSVSPVRSVRGIKMYGCYDARVIGNHCSDYESPIKIQACFRYLIANNFVKNAGLTAGASDNISLSVGSQIIGTNMTHGIVANNVVENSGGIAIGVSGDTNTRCIIIGNQVKGCQRAGIYANYQNAIIVNNRVEDWGLRNSGDFGIHYGSGATVTGNRFRHNTLAGLSCLRSFFDTGFQYAFRDNACETANPMGVTFEAIGNGTITSAATSTGNLAHGLSRTPDIGDITFTPSNNPTNDPGNEWVSGVDATNFVINCRNAPGASTATFRWRASIRMPFTA